MKTAADFRVVVFVLGILLGFVGTAMFVPAIADGLSNNPDWRVFVASGVFTLFFAGLMILGNRPREIALSIRQGFILVTMSWIVTSLFASLPFVFADLKLSFADAYFEAMSGLTTTGSTVIVGLDVAPPGVLLWRALLQWLGGIGIVVVAVAILPFLRVGGMQLFRAESSDRSENVLPKAAEFARVVSLIYVGMSIVAAIAYGLAGMTPFEAACHAMTTISTGGYSTSDQSLKHFNSVAIEAIAMVFMTLGSMPFVLYVHLWRRRWQTLVTMSQVRWFLAIAAGSIVTLAVWRVMAGGVALDDAFRYAGFNVIAVISTTGYVDTDYSLWGPFAITVFFFLIFVGGCTGSTAGGLKIFRVQVLYLSARLQLLRLLYPHGVIANKYDDRAMPENVPAAVLGFFFLFIVTVGTLTGGLTLTGLDFLTAISGAATAIANVGPGLGDVIGPSGTFQSLPDAAKWLLSFGMLLGRLELFTVLVLLVPRFWTD